MRNVRAMKLHNFCKNSHVKYAMNLQAFKTAHYPPAGNFFDNIEAIESSKVFDFIREMPKGAALHVHDIAIASADWIVANITYR